MSIYETLKPYKPRGVGYAIKCYDGKNTALKCACEISDKASSYILSGISKTMEKKLKQVLVEGFTYAE